MSYGYMIASKSSIPELLKNRTAKFVLIKSSNDFYVYSCLYESNELTVRMGEKSFFTDVGKTFFSSITKPYFFIDFLLQRRINEFDLTNIIILNVNTGSCKPIRISTDQELSLNCPYEVLCD